MARTPTTLDLPDLSGRRAIVTGASDGIGLGIATGLARAGAELVLPVRNRAKGERALERVAQEVPGARASLRDLDLSSLASVEALAATLLDEGEPVHLFIGNAGVMTPPERQTTSDGLELQFGSNHIGHVALVARILPLLRAGRARVTSQISIAANRGAINWDDLSWERSYDGMGAYSQSKIAYGLFGIELDRRSRAGGWGITSNLAHPGVAPTSLLAARPELGRERAARGRGLIALLSRVGVMGTPASAALPALLAVTAPDAGGRLFGPRGPGHLGGPPAPQRIYSRLRSEEDARRIWEVSQEIAGVAFPTE